MTVARIDPEGGAARPGDLTPGSGSLRPAALAADLHDGVSQQLFAAALDLSDLRALPGLSSQACAIVDRITGHVEAGSRDLREILLTLLTAGTGDRPPAPDAEPLSDQVAAVVARFAAAHPVAVELRTRGTGPQPTAPAERVLLRAVREGLANVAKHAGAGRAQVVLHRGRRWWTVEVHDDGSGDADAITGRIPPTHSFGLVSLHGEAARLGGRLWVCAAPDLGGVQLNVTLPIGLSALVADPPQV